MIGVVSFVHGWYVEYIPLWIHSILTAYPHYFAKALIHHNLPSHVKESLDMIPNRRFCVLENVLCDKGRYQSQEKKPYYLRWLLPEEYVSEFDKVFMCDVDHFMLPESQPMHRQRDAICDRNKLPFANYVRKSKKGLPPKITGWHYYHTKPYYKAIKETANKILNDPQFDISNPPSYRYDNGTGEKQWGQEALLYQLLKESFRFKDENVRHEFPNHHGLHLGPFRGSIPELVNQKDPKSIQHVGLNMRYWRMYKEIFSLFGNPIFGNLRKNVQNKKAKHVIDKVFHWYYRKKVF